MSVEPTARFRGLPFWLAPASPVADPGFVQPRVGKLPGEPGQPPLSPHAAMILTRFRGPIKKAQESAQPPIRVTQSTTDRARFRPCAAARFRRARRSALLLATSGQLLPLPTPPERRTHSLLWRRWLSRTWTSAGPHCLRLFCSLFISLVVVFFLFLRCFFFIQ